MTDGVRLRAVPAPAGVLDLLVALREESDALKSGDAARLAGAESRRKHLLRLMTAGSAFGRGTVC
jgi:hypothetical protein